MRAGWTVFTSLLILFLAVPCRGQTPLEAELPTVLMIEPRQVSDADTGLYRALRAQLSASPLILERVELPPEDVDVSDPLESASRLAREHDAAMVFWIEQGETCLLFFYMPDAFGGRINSRVIDLNLSSQSSRFEVIAVVASGMIEGLLDSATSRTATTDSTDEKEETKSKRKWIEIFASYTSSLLATDLLCHGGTMGLGFLPIEHLILAAAFSPYAPYRFSNQELELKVVSRQLELLVAGRITIRSVDIRLGVSWLVDLRSLTTTSQSETYRARPKDLINVYSLFPFIQSAWTFRERFGFFGKVGASIAINEPIYTISLTSGSTEVFKPFVVKLFYQLGVFVRI